MATGKTPARSGLPPMPRRARAARRAGRGVEPPYGIAAASGPFGSGRSCRAGPPGAWFGTRLLLFGTVRGLFKTKIPFLGRFPGQVAGRRGVAGGGTDRTGTGEGLGGAVAWCAGRVHRSSAVLLPGPAARASSPRAAATRAACGSLGRAAGRAVPEATPAAGVGFGVGPGIGPGVTAPASRRRPTKAYRPLPGRPSRDRPGGGAVPARRPDGRGRRAAARSEQPGRRGAVGTAGAPRRGRNTRGAATVRCIVVQPGRRRPRRPFRPAAPSLGASIAPCACSARAARFPFPRPAPAPPWAVMPPGRVGSPGRRRRSPGAPC